MELKIWNKVAFLNIFLKQQLYYLRFSEYIVALAEVDNEVSNQFEVQALEIKIKDVGGDGLEVEEVISALNILKDLNQKEHVWFNQVDEIKFCIFRNLLEF